MVQEEGRGWTGREEEGVVWVEHEGVDGGLCRLLEWYALNRFVWG